MVHYAQINTETNKVLRVIVADSKIWCEQNLGGVWVRTYYKTNGKNFAGIGFRYHPENDNFSMPQPYPSWTLNTTTCNWEPPIPYPGEGVYIWNEDEQNWYGY